MTLPPPPAADFPRERTAIVTGAASPRGIGRATAARLAAEGWSVAVLDLDEAACRDVAARIADEHGVACLGIGADIRDRDAVRAAVDRVNGELPQLVGLVNNAGVSSPVPFLEVSEAEWHRVVDVNLHGTFHITQAAAKIMAERRLGRIVNISSTSAERGGGVYGRAAYSASKAALLGLSRTLARELGPYGITANSVAPGSIDTDIMGGRLTDERKAVLLKDLPVGRIGTVRDVAAVVAFLLSEHAGYLTGVTYDVNGGSHIA
ncbi:SDR family NAD(P)-dependent oxidoreductase [Streptomyces malaysiensis]|uniref:SDR family NAD(P)-dependent oxidoreductase n=1 Tax=Streptomyces malaysiensis TaxID=92644 RepID=UPI002043567D|nr:SDR family NAD(P)-dependent oxidoreductase [Streptomyces sp. DR7-3]MCM3808431.1 SDR family oxidoreductase [Streptomyces sp. DR7-3]